MVLLTLKKVYNSKIFLALHLISKIAEWQICSFDAELNKSES